MRFDVITTASPEQVVDALTDFSPRRLETWHRTLDPAKYEVRAVGDTWAVAKEGTAGSPYWVVSRWDWTDPAALRFTIEQSSWGGGGSGVILISPGPRGGSRLHAEWGYTGMGGLRDRVFLTLIHHFPMRNLVVRMWRSALDDHAASARR